MKKLFYAAAALAFAGCSSYSEIARWQSDALTNDGYELSDDTTVNPDATYYIRSEAAGL